MSAHLADVAFEEVDEDTLYAVISGEIDGSNASELRSAVADNVKSATRTMVLDLGQVSYIDSAGVELLFELARRLEARRQALAVVATVGSGVRRVLELCDVGSVASLHEGRAEALAAVGD